MRISVFRGYAASLILIFYLIFIKLPAIIPPEASRLQGAGLFDNKRRKTQ
jgi:hypothetical protein